MYLTELLFMLPAKVNVRIKFLGSDKYFAFTTGPKKTRTAVEDIMQMERNSCSRSLLIHEIIPLWHAQELYITCG